MERAVKILDSWTINQIAAGEIVERPCGIVKELAENSLDAKADKIEAEFDDGGRFIKIKDNGEGIQREDMQAALTRHATSKIRRAADLEGVRTYGFRGEALACVSAVSDLTLISKQAGKPGNKIQSQFGKIGEVLPSNAEDGTTVIVQSLFENTPARFKFLKSAVSETARIKTVLKDLALSQHGLSLKILQKGRLLFYWPGQKSFLDRCRQISGKQDLHWTEKERGGYKLTAVLAAPDDVVRGRRAGRIFVQNRPVEDRVIYSALTTAYRGLLMRGEHPVAFVKLEGPGDEIDVNVHPAKREVRFKNSSLIFGLTESAVRDLLKEAPWTKKVTGRSFHQTSSMGENLQFQSRGFQETHFPRQAPDRQKEAGPDPVRFGQAQTPAADRIAAARFPANRFSPDFGQKRDSDLKAQLEAAPSLFSPSSAPAPPDDPQSPAGRDAFSNKAEGVFGRNEGADASSLFADSGGATSAENKLSAPKVRGPEAASLPLSLQDAAFPSRRNPSAAEDFSGGPHSSVWSSLQVLAQAQLTYLVCQSDKALVFIDQHAAHERVIYERLLDSRRKGCVETQKRLFPFSFEMNDEEEAEALLSLQPELEQTGLVLERAGPLLLATSSSPPILKDQALKEGLQLLAREFIESGDSFSFEKKIADVFASMACHSAVRAGQSLSLEEMRDLLRKMDEFPLSGFCPHGRPVFVEYPVSRLERDFGRTV